MGAAGHYVEPSIRQTASDVGPDEVARAANALPDQAPDLSSRQLGRGIRANPFLAMTCCVGLLAPAALLILAHWAVLAFFVSMVTYRAALVVSAMRQTSDASPPSINAPDRVPRFTLLVPLYKEAPAVPGLVEALKALEYPADRLEVFFLTEKDDAETRAALAQTACPADWQVLSLADSQPRTKPRALNVGLARASGTLIAIYDAEDRPHPAQLMAAVAAYAADTRGDLACVQAPLTAYNTGAGWLPRQWGLEYDVHFGLILPALARAELPIALGGTSNHFRTDVLRAVGGWDAWNVTEDADLGLRLSRLGWRTSVIAPPTPEEAPEDLNVWTAQRSRWIKGYMQTWGVLMRRPVEAVRQMGLRGFVSTQLLLGGAILSAFLHGPLIAWCVLCLLLPGIGLDAASLSIMSLGYIFSAISAALAPGGNWRGRWPLVLSFPLYWPLLSVAAARAGFERISAPYHWAKTPHGLTKQMPKLDPATCA